VNTISSVASSVACAFFRSTLTICDRVLFRKQAMGFFYIYFLSVFFPLLLCSPALFFVKGINLSRFFSFHFLAVATATHLVGLSFSYAFRSQPVQRVVLRAKLPELVLPFIALFLGAKNFAISTMAPLFVSWIAVLPLLLNERFKDLLWNKITLYVSGSLLIQILVTSLIPFEKHDLAAAFELTIGLLFWRCLFTLPFCLRPGKTAKIEESVVLSQALFVIAFRSVFAILTQLTFSWCILKGNPVVVWPIMNMTPLISAVASQYILGERFQKLEAYALIGFVCAAMTPWMCRIIGY